jgi:predicted PurR-regulated permease PerM
MRNPLSSVTGRASGAIVLKVAAVVILGLGLWWFRGVLLLAFGSVLIAVALDALADRLSRLTRLPNRIALAAVVIMTLGFVAATLALFGWRIADQFDEILAKTQASLAQLAALAHAHSWSRELLDRLAGARIDGATMQVAPALASTLGSIGQAAAYSAIVVASGVFLAIEPRRHLDGALLLVPVAHRAAAAAFMARAGAILRKWLVSRLIVMIAIGILSSIGLWLLHIPGAVTLGVAGGLLTFIPLVGALLAAVPPILVALAQSPLLAVYVALMYWAVHFIEGTFITPYVQDAEADLPPVLTMYSALIAAALFGAAGVFLSSPLALMVIVALKCFYLERDPAQPLKTSLAARTAPKAL